MLTRSAEINDVESINSIVNYYINNSSANWAWRERTYEEAVRWFNEHGSNGRHPVFVAECDGKVVGFASLSPFRNKDGYRNIVENSVYLLPEYKGMGIGGILMERLIQHAREHGIWVITAWIDSSNKASIEFHKRFKFKLIGEMNDIGEKWDKACSLTIMNLDLREENNE